MSGEGLGKSPSGFAILSTRGLFHRLRLASTPVATRGDHPMALVSPECWVLCCSWAVPH